jgi:arabinogalactan endo-1,4-beta-galactosidase
MKRLITFLLIAALLQTATAQRYLGGDISLLPSYEKAGAVYRDYKGKQISPLRFFKTQKWNAARVRLFVNPEHAPKNYVEEGVCQDLGYVTALCKQLKEEGYAIMLDFHYSDYWADPGKQTIPHLWKNAAAADLPDTVYRYTRHALERLAEAGIEPEMIQVGNEITNGMLWPVAKIVPTKDGNWETLAALLNSGSKACREVCPKAKLIIHTEKPGSWNITRSFYNQLRRRNVDYDIIGLSYYPMWHGTIKQLGNTLDSTAYHFPDKEVMIVETAAYYSHENDKWAKSPDQYAEFYPISTKGQRQFTRELVTELKRHANVTGLFWWFPEENGYANDLLPCWINRGLFNSRTGKAQPALRELKAFK